MIVLLERFDAGFTENNELFLSNPVWWIIKALIIIIITIWTIFTSNVFTISSSSTWFEKYIYMKIRISTAKKSSSSVMHYSKQVSIIISDIIQQWVCPGGGGPGSSLTQHIALDIDVRKLGDPQITRHYLISLYIIFRYG